MSKSDIVYRLAEISDLDALIKVGDDLFDYPIKVDFAREFLTDPRHILMLAVHFSEVVGMASGFVYVYPDKEPSLFIDEVGVIDSQQGQGIGTSLVENIVEVAFSKFSCKEAWVLTEDYNIGAMRTYKKAGGRQSEPSIMFEFHKKSPS